MGDLSDSDDKQISTLHVGQLFNRSVDNADASRPSKTRSRLSDIAYNLLQEQRSRITNAGRYQDRYKNEFETSYNLKTESMQKRELQSFKLVQSVSAVPKHSLNDNRDVKAPPIPKRNMDSQRPSVNRQQRPPINCIDLRPGQNIQVNLKANLISPKPSPKPSNDKLSSIDTLSALEANIKTIEANTLKNINNTADLLAPNLYGEHENLLKKGISDLVSEGDSFSQVLSKVRNSTGGVEQLNQEKQLTKKVNLNRTASDTQDRPRMTRKMLLNNRTNMQMNKQVYRFPKVAFKFIPVKIFKFSEDSKENEQTVCIVSRCK